MFAYVGPIPENPIQLLRTPLEHGEMAGFWFSIDSFYSQVYLTSVLSLEGLSAETLKNIYDRFINCAIYWSKNSPLVNTSGTSSQSTGQSDTPDIGAVRV